MKPCDYDIALNSKLIRFNELSGVYGNVSRSSVMTERQKKVCMNSLMCELQQLRADIEKMCNGEDHQNEKQAPAKSK